MRLDGNYHSGVLRRPVGKARHCKGAALESYSNKTSDPCMAALDVSETGTSVLVILRSAPSKFDGLDDNGLAVVEARTPIFKAQFLLDEEALESLSTALTAAKTALRLGS